MPVTTTSLVFSDVYYRTTDTHRIHYRTAMTPAAQTLIVCLHGYGGNASAWDEMLNLLNDGRCDFVAIDLPQHGLSSRIEKVSELSLTGILGDLHAIVKREKRPHHKEVLLMGHCFGGIISILLADAYPTITNRLVLINSGYSLPPLLRPLANKWLRRPILALMSKLPSFHRHGMASYAKYKNTSDFSIPRLVTDVSYVGPKYYFLLATLITDIDLSTKIKKLTHHACIIISENDRIFSPSYSRVFAGYFKHHQLAVLPNQNHISIINNPEQVAVAVRQFISSDL